VRYTEWEQNESNVVNGEMWATNLLSARRVTELIEVNTCAVHQQSTGVGVQTPTTPTTLLHRHRHHCAVLADEQEDALDQHRVGLVCQRQDATTVTGIKTLEIVAVRMIVVTVARSAQIKLLCMGLTGFTMVARPANMRRVSEAQVRDTTEDAQRSSKAKGGLSHPVISSSPSWSPSQ